MKRILIIIITMVLTLTVGGIIYMKVSKEKTVYSNFLEIRINNKNDKFNYDEFTRLNYNDLKYYVFTQVSMKELDRNYPIKYLKEKDNIYYTIYSLKDNKLCYIAFKEIDKEYYIDYSWVYSKDMIELETILNLQTDVNYNILETIDKNIIKIDEMSSAYFTIHFFRDGKSAKIEVDSKGKIHKINVSNKSIIDIIYEIDYPEKIMQ